MIFFIHVKKKEPTLPSNLKFLLLNTTNLLIVAAITYRRWLVLFQIVVNSHSVAYQHKESGQIRKFL